MDSILTLILFLLLLYFITYIITKIKNSLNNINYNSRLNSQIYYTNKNFMTLNEYEFYNKIIELETKYNIVPQVNLASVIKKNSPYRYQNELYRVIDFGIFTKDYKKLLLLIELNDNTHNYNGRKDRDLKVKKICNDADIKLMTFYSCYPNEKDYVLNRINQSIKMQNQ
ncbi:MAG: DUF2726 domain-containing protein [Bacilli bacterium]|nr:DUF2726 domain-containing protein [Bacilli bacterium]